MSPPQGFATCCLCAAGVLALGFVAGSSPALTFALLVCGLAAVGQLVRWLS